MYSISVFGVFCSECLKFNDENPRYRDCINVLRGSRSTNSLMFPSLLLLNMKESFGILNSGFVFLRRFFYGLEFISGSPIVFGSSLEVIDSDLNKIVSPDCLLYSLT